MQFSARRLAALLLAALCAACAAPQRPDGPAANDVAVLVLQSIRCKHWWPVPHSEDCLRELLPEFCRRFPGSTVVLGEAPSGSNLARFCEESGVAHYVPRPFSPDALIGLLASLITPWRPIEDPFPPSFGKEWGARL